MKKPKRFLDKQFAHELVEMLQRVEAMYPATKPDSPARSGVIKRMAKVYAAANHFLMLQCAVLDYPTTQWEWEDSKPLEKLAEDQIPGVETTLWYQRHLGMMLNPVDQPLLQIMPYPYVNLSDSQNPKDEG